MQGQVTDPDGEPIAGASVDAWQANDDGFYDVQQPGIQPEYNLRGMFTTDADGRFHFSSVMPGHYPVPDDGPVGEMLSAHGPPRLPAGPPALHRHRARVSAGHHALVRRRRSPYLECDAVFGVKESLIREVVDGVLTFDVSLLRDPAA